MLDRYTRPAIAALWSEARKLATWLVGACCLLYAVQLYLHFESALVIQELLDARGIFAQELVERQFTLEERARTVYTLTNLAHWPTLLIYLMWLYQASNNLRHLRAAGIMNTPAWAVGSYFIPIGNLFLPCMVLQEIWRASDPDHVEGPRSWEKAPASMMIRIWWLVLLVAAVSAGVSSHWQTEMRHFGGGFPADLRDFRSIMLLSFLSNLATLIAGSGFTVVGPKSDFPTRRDIQILHIGGMHGERVHDRQIFVMVLADVDLLPLLAGTNRV